jgi:Phage tail lysozyme
MLPANYAEIVQFLTAHGYTAMAAAGMAGNMYQESMGNPESVGTGGGGLIGWTPLPGGFVTGNPAADLHVQLEAVLTYNQQLAEYIPALNAATTPTEAADIYMNDFERPNVAAAAAYNREGAASAVARACGIAA